MRAMHLILVFVIVGLLSSCIRKEEPATPSTPKTTSAETVALFNGKNLDGWKGFLVDEKVKMEDVWSVQDGILVCKGEPLGYLYTDKDYTNFKLKVEWRWAPGGEPGNSGVLIRINGEHKGLPRCIEAQLKSGDAGDMYGFHGMKIAGDEARSIKVDNHELGGNLLGVKKIEGNEKPPGEWNTYEITANGSNITLIVNGKKVNEARDCDVAAGPLGFQSEGGVIHFRTIEVTPTQ